MSPVHRRVLCAFFVSVAAAVLSGPARATSVDLTTGTTGSVVVNQSFNGETRSADVTLMSASNRQVTSMTVTGVDIRNTSALVGARIYASGGTLIASAAVTAPVGEDQAITVPIAATLVAGSSYRLAFFVPSSTSGNNGDQFDPNPAGAGGFGYVESQGLLQVNGGFQGVGDVFPAVASVFAIPRISLEMAPIPAVAYDLVGYYHRLETLTPGLLVSMVFKAGSAQGCPDSGPTIQPCYNYGQSWTASKFVAAIVGNGAPTWEWDGTTLTATGLFWATSFIVSNPNGAPMTSDKVTNLAITPATNTTTAATYECVEGTYWAGLFVNGCLFTRTGINAVNESLGSWNSGGNAKCVTVSIGGDDYSMVEDTVGVPGTPSPRGLTGQTAGQAGAGCARTSGGISFGTSGAFDLWHVIVDDGTNLILASAPDIGTCYLFGSGTSSACPVDPALAGISYLVLVATGTPPPDADGDTIPDATDNCPATANTDQADADGDLRGNACDNCRTLANNTGAGAQCDSDGDGFGNRCDGDFGNPAPGNGATNSQDSVLFRAQLGQPSVAPAYNKADLNCNGAVNSQDNTLMRGLLGSPPGPGAGP